MRWLILLFCISTYGQTIILSDADIKAFPGAEGFGQNTTGARGLSNVYLITNLNASGSGSARQAFEDAAANGGGWVVPRVAGTVDFTHFFYLGPTDGSAANITYVGQAAPYQGLQFRAAATTGTAKELRVTGSNFIIRHLKSTDAHNDSADGLKIGWPAGDHPMENVMLDHVSIRGALSRSLSLSTKLGGVNTPTGTYLRNITISNSILAASPPPSPMHIIFFGENMTRISFLKNLLTNTKERHPLNNGKENEYEWINNYSYNFWEALKGTVRQKVDVIGNVWDWGSEQDVSGVTLRLVDCSSNACPPSGDTNYTGSQVYDFDNIDNSKTGSIPTYNTEWTNAKQGARILGGDYIPMPASSLKAYILANAGAGVGTAQGRDSFDQGEINHVNNTTGSRPTGRITVPTLTSGGAGAAYPDQDNDGLSDAYEIANGGTATSISIEVRPVTAVIGSGATVDQTSVTTGIRFSHGDIFFADLAGDWDSFSPALEPGLTILPAGKNTFSQNGLMTIKTGG